MLTGSVILAFVFVSQRVPDGRTYPHLGRHACCAKDGREGDGDAQDDELRRYGTYRIYC